MKIYQIFFSPTGGVRKASDLFCRGLGLLCEPIDLMRHVGPLDFSPEDLCVIAVPVYGGRVPKPALKALRAMTGNGVPAILMAVFGNRAVDDALLELQDECYASGFHCIAGIEAVAEHSLFRQFGQGRPDQQDAKEMIEFAHQILKKLQTQQELDMPQLPGNRPYRAFGGTGMQPKATRQCAGCGVCAGECPAQAIPREEPHKVDKSKCITCMHCVAVCPQQARRLGWLDAWKGAKRLRERCQQRKPNRLYL